MRRLFGLFAALLIANPAWAQTGTPAATLDADSLPATSSGATLLHVTAAGRFAITARSASGTALDLVDMITGPTPLAGAPGAADGRLDLLLDAGTYKLRTHPAADATGTVRLHVAPFTQAGAVEAALRDAETDSTLADLQQRSFWLKVSDNQPLRLEAAGRALADLRLWRNGRDLMALTPAQSQIEPTHGHPLRDFLLTERLPPGVYLVTAYGGPPLPWADGDKTSPFSFRTGLSQALRPGWVGGHVGPFGTEVFATSGSDDLVRLSMEGPALLSADGVQDSIDKKARVPQAELRTAQARQDHIVTVSAAQGAAFQLRSEEIGEATSLWQQGDWWVSARSAGFGGDDVPATFILAKRHRFGPLAVVASNAPEIGPGAGWRQRFNLRGRVDVLFHVAVGGKVALVLTGVPTDKPRLTALDAVTDVPQAGQTNLWDVPEGWYQLSVSPTGHAAGVADMTISTPGAAVSLGPPGPASPSVTFGEQHLGWQEQLVLFGNAAPGARFGLTWQASPLDSAAVPVRIGQLAGQATDVPLRAGQGTLTAVELGAGAVPVSYDQAAGLAHVPATGHPREVSLYWRAPEAEAEMPAPEPESAQPVLHDRVAQYFDFEEDTARSFTLDVAQGGLFRVETLGRLHTGGTIGTHFVPELQNGEANGIGQNMLLQGWLRAGSYHVDVTARQSFGHAGVVARPAPLATSLALQPGRVLRATLAAGSGLLVPVDITAPGLYRLELLGLNRVFEARLEDSGGWPLAVSAPLQSTTQELAAGRYRLLVMPQATDARAVIRLTQVVTPPKLTGHGPHALTFGTPQAYTWREPAGRNEPRTPDDWHFALAAPAAVTLSISDGIDAILIGADGTQAAHIVGGTPFTGWLQPGAWRLDARSQGRNDRLDYQLSLQADQLQPGIPNSVKLPGRVSFNLAEARVASLTSFGGVPVRAVLRGADGRVLGRYGARADDWNVAISTLLQPGAYTLDLAGAMPPYQRATPRNGNDRAGSNDTSGSNDGSGSGDSAGSNDNAGSDNSAGNPPDAQPDADGSADTQGQDAVQSRPDGGDAQQDQQDNRGTGQQAGSATTDITLSIPPEAPAETLGEVPAILAGGLVHHLTLKQPAVGQLVVAGAISPAPLAVALERQDAAGTWRSLASEQGRSAVLAVPADALPGAWRLSVWPVDGGSEAIRVAARLASLPASPGAARLLPFALPGIADSLALAHVAVSSKSVLGLAGAADLRVAAWPGHAAAAPQARLVVPQSADFWLMASHPARIVLAPPPAGAPVTLTLAQGELAGLPQQSGALTAWVAEAPGQPGFAPGQPTGVSDHGAIAVVSTGTASLRVADDAERIRATARAVSLALAPGLTLDGSLAATLPPTSATELVLDPGLHALRLALPPGTAAIAGWPDQDGVTVWAGQSALSRTLEGRWSRLLLVNTNQTPAAVSVAQDALAAADVLGPDRSFRRFFGAAGSLDLPVTGAAGQTLVVAGDASGVFIAEDGQVQRGTRLNLAGPGRLTLDHKAGLAAVWLEGPGASPWPQPVPTHLALPCTLTLSGGAMRLSVNQARPALLRIRSTAPVLLGVAGEAPSLFPAGAALSRYVPAGETSLLVISAQDGALSGSLEVSAAPIHPATDGLGETVTTAPGDSVLFGFTLAAPTRIGIGVQAEPDRVSLTLLDASGRILATGAAMLPDLKAGSYVLQAQVPADGPATVIRPAIVGLAPRPDGPPADVVQYYRELAGLTAPKGRTP